MPAQGNIALVNGLTVGQTYRVVVRGMFEFSIGGGSWADAQWTTYTCPPMILCTYFRAVVFNGVQLAAQNGQDVVDPNHEYIFFWTADAPRLQMYILDSDYSDNSGALTYEISSESPDAGLDIFLSPADNLIQNGDFEIENLAVGGWITSGTITPVVTSTMRHTGRQSVLLVTTALSQTGNSAIAQMVTIPVTMTSSILSFLYRPGGTSSLENGLVSYWKLDEATGNALDALGTNILTAVNAPGSTPGIVQTARTFSGDHQYFSIPTRPSVEVGNTSFTFTAWVKLDNKTDYHTFVGKQIEDYPFYDRDYSLSYDKDMDRIYFQVAGPDGLTLTRAIANALGSPAINTWYFLAGGYDYESGYIWISVNGGPQETTPFTGSVHVGQAPFMLGGVANPLFGYHAGLLDEVGFWKRALTSAEVAALYNNGQGQSYPFAVNGNALDVQVDNGITNTTVFTTAVSAADWTHQWLDLSAWKGQTITVSFTFHQNTPGLPAWMYLDEVSLGSGQPDVWVQLANPPIGSAGKQGNLPAYLRQSRWRPRQQRAADGDLT